MTEQQTPLKAPSRAPLWIGYLVMFIAFVDTFALLPIMGPYAASLGATGLGIGLVVGALSFSDILFNVVGGVLLDRRGRRRLAILGFALVSVAVLLYPTVSSVGALVATRLLHGVGTGILIPAIYAVIADLSRAGGRGRSMGRVGAAIGAAAVVAPAISAIAREQFGFTAVFIGLGCVMVIGLAVTATAVRETIDRDALTEAGSSSIRSLLGIRSLQVACIAAFGFTFGFGSLSGFLSNHLEAMGERTTMSGALFTLLAAVAVVLMLTRFSSRVDVSGPRRPVLIGLPAIVLGLGLVGIGDGLGFIAAGMASFGVGFGIVYPAITGATAMAATAPERGRAFGVFSVCYSLGFVVGPPLAGFASDRWGVSPFLFAAGAAAIATVVVFLLRDREADAG